MVYLSVEKDQRRRSWRGKLVPEMLHLDTVCRSSGRGRDRNQSYFTSMLARPKSLVYRTSEPVRKKKSFLLEQEKRTYLVPTPLLERPGLKELPRHSPFVPQGWVPVPTAESDMHFCCCVRIEEISQCSAGRVRIRRPLLIGTRHDDK